jgi:protein SCO1
MKKIWIATAGLVASLAALGAIIFVWLGAGQNFHGTRVDPPYAAGDFTLQSDQGTVNLSAYRGKVVLLYFGYTFCPDICPASLSKVARAYQLLGKDASRLQTIFISVDPERDTIEKLGPYARTFNPTFIGATGSADEIAAVAKQYGVFYQKRAVTTAAGYLVDHTAVVWVIDMEGKLHLEWPYDMTGADMAADLKLLLR